MEAFEHDVQKMEHTSLKPMFLGSHCTCVHNTIHGPGIQSSLWPLNTQVRNTDKIK